MIFIHCSLVGYSVALILRGHGFKFHGRPKSFSGFLRNCINCVHNRKDRSSFVLDIIASNHSVKVIVIHVILDLHCVTLQEIMSTKRVWIVL